MENEILIALIGVGGTLLGTILGWLLNALSYKIGKTTIFATPIQSMDLPPISLNGKQQASERPPKIKYLYSCIASNSRQVPVILDHFHVEMKLSKNSKPVRLSVLMPEDSCVEVKWVFVSAPLSLPRQVIEPRTLTEFTFRVDYDKPDIQYAQIKLVAYNEKHQRQSFLIYNGFKCKPPPK